MKHLPGIGSRSTEDYINEYFDNPETKVFIFDIHITNRFNILVVQSVRDSNLADLKEFIS